MNDLSEKEQLDELRNWWQENRAWILSGVAIGIIAIVGYRMYTTQQLTAALQASTQFEELVDAVADNRLEAADSLAAGLFADYGGTVYAKQARLAMARLYMDRGRDADAADVLRPLATARGDDPLTRIGRLRLARILLYQGKPQEALDLLDVPGDSAFGARFNELAGDAHVALGNTDDAAAAYEKVLQDDAAAQTVNVQLVRMKLDDLPAAGEAPAPDATDTADTAQLPAEGTEEEPPQ